ncbi:MAG: DegT/DnrJ/EryC1/StrS family aminotransferase [Planctomycetes bacterium]|nr:DegT/DnrJ/EryC1/StrS family aminotransferase [Planctomycetota bacterium]
MIPVSEPLLGAREQEYVAECLRTGWISSSGRFIELFEQRWAAYCGRRHGVAMCNGTAALVAAVRALGLRRGDEVIVPTFTIISCALAVLEAGATPVWVDADPDTWTLDVAQLEDRITPRTRAIMAVHLYGHPVDMDAVLTLAQRCDLRVIEDAAEAHGAEYLEHRGLPDARWRRCGSFGDASCFSFYANKIVTTGEGGMVLIDDAVLAESLRAGRNLGFQTSRRFVHEVLGFNFRMTNLQAAIGAAQLERVDELVARKREIGQQYTRRLAHLPALQLPVERPWARTVYWMYGVVLHDDAPMTAADLAAVLHQRGVETRPFFLGMHEQPVLCRMGLGGGDSCPVATRLARRGLYLPSGVGLSDDDVARVCDVLHKVLA